MEMFCILGHVKLPDLLKLSPSVQFRAEFEVLRLCKVHHLVIMIIMSKLLQSDYTII